MFLFKKRKKKKRISDHSLFSRFTWSKICARESPSLSIKMCSLSHIALKQKPKKKKVIFPQPRERIQKKKIATDKGTIRMPSFALFLDTLCDWYCSSSSSCCCCCCCWLLFMEGRKAGYSNPFWIVNFFRIHRDRERKGEGYGWRKSALYLSLDHLSLHPLHIHLSK